MQWLVTNSQLTDIQVKLITSCKCYVVKRDQSSTNQFVKCDFIGESQMKHNQFPVKIKEEKGNKLC